MDNRVLEQNGVVGKHWIKSVNPGFTTSQLWKPQQVTFLLGILFLLYKTASKDLPWVLHRVTVWSSEKTHTKELYKMLSQCKLLILLPLQLLVYLPLTVSILKTLVDEWYSPKQNPMTASAMAPLSPEHHPLAPQWSIFLHLWHRNNSSGVTEKQIFSDSTKYLLRKSQCKFQRVTYYWVQSSFSGKLFNFYPILALQRNRIMPLYQGR